MYHITRPEAWHPLMPLSAWGGEHHALASPRVSGPQEGNRCGDDSNLERGPALETVLRHQSWRL
jgi:hypothetical protein